MWLPDFAFHSAKLGGISKLGEHPQNAHSAMGQHSATQGMGRWWVSWALRAAGGMLCLVLTCSGAAMHENFPQVWKQRKGSYVANTTSAYCQLCLFWQYQELEETKRKQCSELKSHQQEIEELSFVMQRWQCDLENVKKRVRWSAFTLKIYLFYPKCGIPSLVFCTSCISSVFI